MSQPLEAITPQKDKVELLKKVDLFEPLHTYRGFLEALANDVEFKTYRADEFIFQEGIPGENLFILWSGYVYVQKKNPDGDVYNVVILRGEDHPAIGEGGLIEKSIRSATVKCKTDCEFLVWHREDFLKFCDDHPKWGVEIYRSIFKIMVQRLRIMNTDLLLMHKALTNEIRGD